MMLSQAGIMKILSFIDITVIVLKTCTQNKWIFLTEDQLVPLTGGYRSDTNKVVTTNFSDATLIMGMYWYQQNNCKHSKIPYVTFTVLDILEGYKWIAEALADWN